MGSVLPSFAQITNTCTINGRPASGEECAQVFKLVAIILIPIFIVLFALFIWWIFTLIHVIKHEDVPNRIVWLILHFIGLGLLVAPIYHFAVKRPYDRLHPASSKPAPQS
ncbi:hypothetical protein HY441_00040 [Candidatus Microgenomates bacterium]|nr:hypothetical protein [Candidatus Microgenomates bacterium]